MDVDLEDRPAAVVRIRYEFRDQLVRMGVLSPTPDPLTRREHARGFSGGYWPDPFGGRSLRQHAAPALTHGGGRGRCRQACWPGAMAARPPSEVRKA